MIRPALVLASLVFFCNQEAHAASCEGLSSLKLQDTKVTLAQTVTGGQLTLPDGSRRTGLPVFCRVAAVIQPTSDSVINFEVWMPQDNWAGRFLSFGNSGLAGRISYTSMAAWLPSGFALASTDTGHSGTDLDADWGRGHPEKVIDYGYRAVHLMTVQSKAIIAAYYGKPADHSYWWGCSCGGGQGLALAQRYPADYDGIVAGAPASYETHLDASGLWVLHAVVKDPASAIPMEWLAPLQQIVVEACDALDGLRDGLIEDPRRCRFDLSSLACKAGETTNCLTPAQGAALKKVYGGAVNPRTGEQILPGPMFGSEGAWRNILRLGSPSGAISRNLYMSLVFEDPGWDWRNFDFDRDVAFADGKLGIHVNHTNPDLRAFRAMGHKLLQWHGWADEQIPPLGSVQYYESVRSVFASYNAHGNSAPADIRDFYRLFLVPGVNHCGGGNGADVINVLDPLIEWVEKGTAPDRIESWKSSGGKRLWTRPVCPYPQVARWTGTGDSKDGQNFVCVDPTGAGTP